MPNCRISINIWIILILFCFFPACQNQSTPKDATPASTPSIAQPAEEAARPNPPQKDLFYAWVDKLNIRDTPSTKGKILSTVQSKDPLEFTGEKSEENETIVLRGVAYDEVWLKVLSPDKTEGWVFGGAVKHQGESKGNPLISDEQFDFPHFGQFDLSTWNDMGTKKEEGGDAEIVYHSYRKGKQFLQITHSEVGEYGYGYTYQLKDDEGQMLKERELNFVADMDFRELKETVTDYTVRPPKQYSRSQKMKKHFMQLNARPLMVNGPWTTSTLATEK